MATFARTAQECERAGFGQFNEGRVIDAGPGPEGETPTQAYRRWSAGEELWSKIQDAPLDPSARLNPFYLWIGAAP